MPRRNEPHVVTLVPAPTDLSQNPFYIHPSENPVNGLVNPPLNGKNYNCWSRLMKNALITKNKVGFIDGSFPCPEDSFDPGYDAWHRCNNLVHSWIVNSVTPNIAQSILFVESAADVWIELKERFAQGNSVRVAELQQELYMFKQGTLSVSEYFTQLKVFWEELDNCRSIPRCRCDAMAELKKFKHDDCVMRFVMGLNDDFNLIRTQILMMDPLPALNRAFSSVVQFGRQNGLEPDVDDNQALINVVDKKKVNAVDKKKPYGRGRSSNNDRVCTHCGKSGHTIEICYKKHGFPPGFKFKNGNVAINAVEKGEDECVKNFVPSFSVEEHQELLSLLKSSSLKDTGNVHTVNNACTTHCAGEYEGFSEESDWFW